MLEKQDIGNFKSETLHFPNVSTLMKISLGLILFTMISTVLVYAQTTDDVVKIVENGYLEENSQSTLGLLTTILDPKAQEFHARCEKTFRRKIEHVPLIYPLLSKVERPPQEAMLFYSFEQCYHMQWGG